MSDKFKKGTLHTPPKERKPIGSFFSDKLMEFVRLLQDMSEEDKKKITDDLGAVGLDINNESELDAFCNGLQQCTTIKDIKDQYYPVLQVIAKVSQQTGQVESGDQTYMTRIIVEIASKISKALGNEPIHTQTDGDTPNESTPGQQVHRILQPYNTFASFIADYVNGKCSMLDEVESKVVVNAIWKKRSGGYGAHTNGYDTPHMILTHYHLYKDAPRGDQLLKYFLPLRRREDPLFRIQCVAQAVAVEKKVTQRLKSLGRINTLQEAINEEMQSLANVTDLGDRSPHDLRENQSYRTRMYIFLECLCLLRDTLYLNNPNSLDKIFETYGDQIFEKFDKQIRVTKSERHWKQRIQPEIEGFLLEGQARKMINDGNQKKCVKKLKEYVNQKITHYTQNIQKIQHYDHNHNDVTSAEKKIEALHNKVEKLEKIQEQLESLENTTDDNTLKNILKDIRVYWLGERATIPYKSR